MTANSTQPGVYRGRFAPSPTGPLHFGSLIAALASYLDARCNQGEWLVRMEDVDLLRNVPGSDAKILATLEQFGFEWDGEVAYQSQRTELYQDVLQRLHAEQQIYYCVCSRKSLRATAPHGRYGIIYPGTCRDRNVRASGKRAIRVKVNDDPIAFDDRCFGTQTQNLQTDLGDFIIRRSDGLFAYQLAVVVDDADQQINQVVRGADLLDSTPRQIHLQRLLGYATPGYLHLPLALNADGEKLSKQTHAPALQSANALVELLSASRFLGQNPPADLLHGSLTDFWRWSISHWDTSLVPVQLGLDYPDIDAEL